jgi:hypothetical protein
MLITFTTTAFHPAEARAASTVPCRQMADWNRGLGHAEALAGRCAR